MIKKLSILVLTLIFAVACKKEKSMETVKTIQPPLADKKAKTLEKHGDIRVDNYFWLNEKENEEVIDYLERENDYFNKKMAHTEDFQKSLFEEMKGRIKEDDSSVPYKYNGYWYITKFEKGKETRFSWTFTIETGEEVALLKLYNGTNNKENILWDQTNKNSEKGEEMFNGRLEVNYDKQKEITVTIKDAMLNDSITILVTGTFLNNADVKLSEKFKSSVTLDVKGNLYYFK